MRLIDGDALADSLRESKNKMKEILDDERCEMEYRICEGQMITFIEAILRVNETPTVDAVPVVRCKDCENWDTGWKPADAEDDEQFCVCFARVTMSDEFCSRGERRCMRCGHGKACWICVKCGYSPEMAATDKTSGGSNDNV